jgi:predicted kinase
LARVILVVGATGAGKTTYARKLADELGALRFSIDEWMGPLFAKDSPQPIQFEWMMERIGRCEAMMLTLVSQAARRGVSSVLDLGFTKRAHREAIAAACADAGYVSAIHFVDGDSTVRWERVKKRNLKQGETYVMQVDRAMFDFMEAMWEPPFPEEWQANGGLRVTMEDLNV